MRVKWIEHTVHAAVVAVPSLLVLVVLNIFVDVPALIVLVWIAATLLVINRWSVWTGAVGGR